MKLERMATLIVSGSLLSLGASSYAEHKTGLEFQLDLKNSSEEDDTSIKGDKSQTAFSLKRARWYLGGDYNESFDYKFRFKFKDGNVALSYAWAGYKLNDQCKITFGTDRQPIAGSVPDSYRMSDDPITSLAEDQWYFGDAGVGFSHSFGSNNVSFGLSNNKKGAVGTYNPSLNGLAYGLGYNGTFGPVTPVVSVGISSTPEEKSTADVLQVEAFDYMDSSIGAGINLGATDIFIDYHGHSQGDAKFFDAGTSTEVPNPKKEITSMLLKVNHKLNDKMEGGIKYVMDEVKTGGTKSLERAAGALQFHYFPKGNAESYMSFSYVTATSKVGTTSTTDTTKNDIIFTFSANPSTVL